jgi:hypothetical protein
MGRARTPKSISKFIATPGQPQIYAEGKHEYAYLTGLADSGVISPYEKGTKLMASEVKRRVEAIKRDLANDAIDCVIWIVDGGDQHIKKSNDFIDFYKEWRSKKDGAWKKLHVLINAPCLEYWFFLHRTDPPIDAKKDTPVYFENAEALLYSAEFKKHCQEGKGPNLVKAIVSDAAGRKQAIQRAKDLSNFLNNLAEKKNFLKVARAEMYQIFELMKVETPNYSSLKSA